MLSNSFELNSKTQSLGFIFLFVQFPGHAGSPGRSCPACGSASAGVHVRQAPRASLARFLKSVSSKSVEQSDVSWSSKRIFARVFREGSPQHIISTVVTKERNSETYRRHFVRNGTQLAYPESADAGFRCHALTRIGRNSAPPPPNQRRTKNGKRTRSSETVSLRLARGLGRAVGGRQRARDRFHRPPLVASRRFFYEAILSAPSLLAKVSLGLFF